MAITPKIRTNDGLSRQGKGQCRNQQTKAKSRAPVFSGYGFLKHRFLPLSDGRHEELAKWQQVEGDFFTSLSYLADLYGFELARPADSIFPDNIRYAFVVAAEQVKQRNPQLSLIIVQDKSHPACLATIKPLNTGMTLFYIPLRPLWRLLQDRKKNRLAALVLSMYAYLYQVVQIPSYTDPYTYLGTTYEMIADWITEDPTGYDPEDYAAMCSDLNALQWHGKDIIAMMKHPYPLQLFESRVQSFQPADETEAKLHEISSGFLSLYQQYPKQGILDNIHYGWIDPQEEDRIDPEQYLSFFWDYEDSIYEQLFQTVNTDLQEKGVIDEPVGMQLFDRPQAAIGKHELDFEHRLFELIGTLTSVL